MHAKLRLPILIGSALTALLVAERSEAVFFFATGSVERLSVSDYRLTLSYQLYADGYDIHRLLQDYGGPAPPPWAFIGPYGSPIGFASGNFQPPFAEQGPELSAVIQPLDPGTLRVSLGAIQDYFYEYPNENGFPLRDMIGYVSGEANFYASLPQEIGTSTPLTQTPEVSSIRLLALGVLGLQKKRGLAS